MVGGAAGDAGLDDEGDHAHHAVASGTDEGIDPVDPAEGPGPSAAKGGPGWGQRREKGRSGGGRLSLQARRRALSLQRTTFG